MAEFIIMPKLGFNMDTGQLVKWHKAEGDSIKKGDVVFEIQTDKTTMEIEATSEGTLLKILVAEGETVPVILPVAIVGGATEDISALIREAAKQLGKPVETVQASAPAVAEAAPVAAQSISAAPAEAADLKLSPRARKYAAEQGLDLSGAAIAGTGFQGGVTQKDVEEYNLKAKATPLAKKMADAAALDLSGIAGTGISGKITKDDVQAAMKVEKSAAVPAAADGPEILRTVDYSGIRKVIGDRLSQSKFTAPHLYFTVAVDVSELAVFRGQVNNSQPQKVSFNDFVIAAVAGALRKLPEMNSALRGDKIVQYKDVNIGVAVALENGLIVPVVKQAQNKKLTAIAAETQSLAEKARTGKLLPSEYQGGTFTVSNLGMFGVDNFTAIINPPEAAILSVSAMKKAPVVVTVGGEDQIQIRTMMNITVSVDHRLIDGLTATKFLTEVKAFLEKPLSILI